MSDSNANADLEVVEHADGWAVTRGDEILATHGSRAGAESDLFRLAKGDADDAGEADDILTDEQGARPDNEGA